MLHLVLLLCYTFIMTINTNTTSRIFKTAWFTKAAKKARITDKELCSALHQVIQGQGMI